MPTPTSTDPASPAYGGDGGTQPTSRASEIGQKAADAIDEKREAVADGIDSAASSLHARAESLPGGEKIVSAAHTAAEAMEKTADYLRDQDLNDMLSDVQQVVKRHPGITLFAAAVAGFILARVISRD
jgi:hypothetical protein